MALDSNCVFCKICKGEAPASKIYEDDEILIFKDIKPAATHHYLAIPKLHIKNVKSLSAEHRTLCKKMHQNILVEQGKASLAEQGGNLSDVLMGFHWPPFNSVSHLHLHLIAPMSEMSLLHRYMFKPDSMWFVSVDYVKENMLVNKL